MVTIGYSKSATNTEAFALIAEAWNEMVQEGFSPDGIAFPPIGPTSEVIYAVGNEGDVTGCIVFDQDAEQGVVNVRLAYVEPSSRRKKIFSEMFAALRSHAQRRGAQRILVATSDNNDVGHRVNSALEGVQWVTVYAHEV